MALDYTTRRGRTHLHSEKQHRFMHARLSEGDHSGDHTHIEAHGKRVRETADHRSVYYAKGRR